MKPDALPLRFDGRVALVTGAGGGLGAAYAHWLADRGAKVVVNNRVHPDRPSSAEAVAAAISASGSIAVANHEAVGAAGSGARMVEQALDCFGRLDIVIANAAISAPGEIASMTCDDYRAVMDINFCGSIDPILAALPHMRQRDYGRIIVTASASSLFGAKTHTAYSASKMALVGFARSLSVELKRTNIKINTVSPYARTKMSSHLISDRLEEVMAPERVAPAVGWLVSEACDRSGTILSIGGGRARRVVIVETAPSPSTDDKPLDWDMLDDLDGAIETIDSRWSSTALVPELIEPKSKTE